MIGQLNHTIVTCDANDMNEDVDCKNLDDFECDDWIHDDIWLKKDVD